MRIGYLTNRYPAVSHTFVRREIAGVEACGAEVRRFSIRVADPQELVDADDRAEAARTEALLASGFPGLVGASLVTALAHPVRLFRAVRTAWRLGGRSHRGRMIHLAYLAEACLLLRKLKRGSVDHLHAHFGTNPAAVALLCRVLGGPPYSFTVHGPEEFDGPEALSLPEKIRSSAFVVGISDFGRGQLMRWSDPSGWSRLHVVRCGVDHEFLAGAAASPSGRRRFVCVGRLCADKGQLLLVQAAAALLREGFDFETVLIGDGAIRPRIEEEIRASGAEGRIHLRGWMDGAGVRREIADSHTLVLPSLAEGLPVVIMEALALGRPVISTYVAGIPELVKPGANGWLVQPGSIGALTAALREALQTPVDRLAAMGRAGAAAVAERHDALAEAAKLVALFRAVPGVS